MNIHIREYSSSDQKLVIELLRLNTPKYFAPEEENDFIQYLENEIDFYYVIELENKLVGCGGINFRNETTGIISWGIIHPEYHKMKLGSKLLKHRISELQKFTNIDRITVRTTQLVFPFFEKNGFKIVQIVDNYWAEGFHLYEMDYSN
jgi:N-acetylglutamate synthase-like GNAT family acetyltransferase